MSGALAAAVADLDSRTRPLVLAHQQRLAVGVSLSALLPQGVQRGSTVVVGSPLSPEVRTSQGVRAPRCQGATSLALEFLAGVSRSGGWCAVVGLPSLGLVAAVQLGVRLERLALVPEPGDQWPVVAAALIDSVDVLLLAPPARATLRDARRLAARARERGAILVVLDPCWPDRGDLHLAVRSLTWSGLGRGEGYLQGRRVEVVLSGRGSAARERKAWMGLPAAPEVGSPEVGSPEVGSPEVGLPETGRVVTAVGLSMVGPAEKAG